MEARATNALQWGSDLAQKYLESSRKYYWTAEQLSEISKYFPVRKSVFAVDVGTGQGAFAFYLKSVLGVNSEVWGVDIDEKLIQHARRISTANDISVKFEVASTYNLPFPSGSVDIMTEQLVLLHLKSPELALKEMYRCLAPQGVAVFIEPNNTAISLIDDSAKRQLTSEEYQNIVSLDFSYNRGKEALGEGDSNMGDMLIEHLQAFRILEIKLVERVDPIHPPYTEAQREIIEFLYGDDSYNQSYELYHRYCLATGMAEEEFQRKWQSLRKLNEIRKEQVRNRNYFGLHLNIDYVFVCQKP